MTLCYKVRIIINYSKSQWILDRYNYSSYRIYIAENFHRVKFFKVYFRGLIFVVCLEHVIIVAYCLDFFWLIFRFRALRNKNNTQ